MSLHQIVKSHPLVTAYGKFDLDVFYDGRQEASVLRYGDVRNKEDVLCRVQSACMNHHFFDVECDCREQMDCSLAMISAEDGPQRGLVILLPQEGKGNGFGAQIYHNVEDVRDYRVAAEIIRHYYRIRSIILISSNKRKISDLRERKVHIRRVLWYRGRYFRFTPALKRTVADIDAGHSINPIGHENNAGEALTDLPTTWEEAKTRVLVCGDLNIDQFITADDEKTFLVGGTAYTACRAFYYHGFMPVLFGAVGDDGHGRRIRTELRREPYYVVIRVNRDVISAEDSETKSTCVVQIHKSGDPRPKTSANWNMNFSRNGRNALLEVI